MGGPDFDAVVSTYTVRLVPDWLDGGWISSCDELPGCMSQGETQAEAILNIHDAIAEVLSARADGSTASNGEQAK